MGCSWVVNSTSFLARDFSDVCTIVQTGAAALLASNLSISTYCLSMQLCCSLRCLQRRSVVGCYIAVTTMSSVSFNKNPADAGCGF